MNSSLYIVVPLPSQRSDKDKNIIQSLPVALENLKDAIMSHDEIIVHDRTVPTVEHEVN